MPDGRLRKPLPHGLAAAVRLDHDIDRLNPVEVLRVPVLPPVVRTRNADSRDTVVPEGVNVGLAFDQDDGTGIPRLGETIEPVELRLRTCLPTEAVALKRNPKPHRQQLAACSEVGNANSGPTLVGDLR